MCATPHPTPPTLHGTTIARDGAAVLLRGPSGTGKSDMALRLIMDRGFALVADDRTILTLRKGTLVAEAPCPLAGLLEVRGLGILPAPRTVGPTPLALVVDLCPGGPLERLPDPDRVSLLGVTLPLVRLDPWELAAAHKLDLALLVTRGDSMGWDDPKGNPKVPPRLTPHPATLHRDWTPPMVTVPISVNTSSNSPAQRPPPLPEGQRRVVLVTGMSGAGRSSALRALEDLGYEAVDNLPLYLLDALISSGQEEPQPLALGIDTRTRGFDMVTVLSALKRLKQDGGFDTHLLFIDADTDILERRFTETRRRHPLAQERPIADGIAMERRLLTPLKDQADRRIDTTTLAPGQLKGILEAEFALDSRGEMTLFITSFGFRNGLPREADLVFDARFLTNPHYDPKLRPLTGLDPAVAAFVGADPDYAPFLKRVTDLLELLLPRYEREGKSYLTLAIGCTGGKHRSVYTAERLAAWLGERGCPAQVRHRDIHL